MKLQYKELPGKVVSWDDATLTITHFISTETQDSGGDVMIAKGMQLRGKPVVLFQHGQDPVFGNEPIAKALKIEAGENEGKVGILATTQYFDDRKLTVPSSVGERLYMKAKDEQRGQEGDGHAVIRDGNAELLCLVYPREHLPAGKHAASAMND